MPLSGDRVLVESLSISKLSLEPLRQPAFVWENTLPLRPKTIFKHEVEEKIENQRVIDSLQAYSCILDIALS